MARKAKEQQQPHRGVVVRYKTCETPETLFRSAQAVLELIDKTGDPHAYHTALSMLEEPDTSTHKVCGLPADRDTIRRLVAALYRKINEQLHPWHGYDPLEHDPQDDSRQAVCQVQQWCLRNMEKADRERVLTSNAVADEIHRHIGHVKTAAQPSEPVIPVTDLEIRILKVLDPSIVQTNEDILTKLQADDEDFRPPSDTTIKNAVNGMRDRGLVERPLGPRQGARLTTAGTKLREQHPSHTKRKCP